MQAYRGRQRPTNINNARRSSFRSGYEKYYSTNSPLRHMKNHMKSHDYDYRNNHIPKNRCPEDEFLIHKDRDYDTERSTRGCSHSYELDQHSNKCSNMYQNRCCNSGNDCGRYFLDDRDSNKTDYINSNLLSCDNQQDPYCQICFNRTMEEDYARCDEAPMCRRGEQRTMRRFNNAITNTSPCNNQIDRYKYDEFPKDHCCRCDNRFDNNIGDDRMHLSGRGRANSVRRFNDHENNNTSPSNHVVEVYGYKDFDDNYSGRCINQIDIPDDEVPMMGRGVGRSVRRFNTRNAAINNTCPYNNQLDAYKYDDINNKYSTDRQNYIENNQVRKEVCMTQRDSRRFNNRPRVRHIYDRYDHSDTHVGNNENHTSLH